MRTPRTALAAIVAAGLMITACGDPKSAGNATELPKIRVAGGAAAPASRSAAAEGAAMPADGKMMAAFSIYKFQGAWPNLPKAATGYRMETKSIDEARVRQLAAAFGVGGEPNKLPADQGGGWQVGANDGTGPSLWVSGTGIGDWSYNSASTASAGCAPSGVVTPTTVDGANSNSSAGSTGSAVADPAVIAEPAPDASLPPVDAPICDAPRYPDTATLVAHTNKLLATLKMGDWQLDTSGASYGSIVGTQSLGGVRSPMQFNVTFSPEGQITWASGSLATPVAAGEYPLLSAEQALARFNERSRAMFRDVQPLGPADEVIGTEVTPAVGVAATPIDEGPAAPDMTIGIAPMPPIEAVEVAVDTVTMGLTMLWDVDGVVWVVPAYEFSNADGITMSIEALPDEYLEQPPVETTMPPETSVSNPPAAEPVPPISAPSPVTPPTEPTAPAGGVAVPQALQQVVGLAEDEAIKVITEYGWTARVVSIDGVGQPVTMDLRMDRLNLDVTNGIVTAISVG